MLKLSESCCRSISGNSSIDISLICDIYCGPEILFETCIAMKFVDDDDGGGGDVAEMLPGYFKHQVLVLMLNVTGFGWKFV